MRNLLPDAIWRRVNQVLRAVPHVTGTAHWTHAGASQMATLTIRVDGWGPTLHETAYDVGHTYQDERHMLADAVDMARRAAAEQQLLADTAAAWGMPRPLFRDAPNPTRELTPADGDHVARMHIERVLADALVDAHGPAAAAERTVRAIDDLLRVQQTGGLRLRGSGSAIEATPQGIVLQPAHMIGGPAEASLHGSTLDIRCAIPDTLLAAATGRPLGELVATGTASLDAAIVEETLAYGATGVQLRTPCDLVLIGEHDGLSRGLAAACRRRVAAIEDPARPRAPRLGRAA